MAGNYALKTVTYPYDANITYTYQHIDFTPTDLSLDRTTAIATKEVSGNPPGISVGPGSSLPFVGGGQTAGGAREFVVPNGPIPSGASTEIIGP